ncbi:tyrosine-type recombinase/integrase [Nocardia asteroides]
MLVNFGPCEPLFVAERAVLPSDESVAWVIVDSEYRLHAEGCAFLAGLRALDRSPNTERVYAGRIALYLSYCAAAGLAWSQITAVALAGFLRWLTEAPLPDRTRKPQLRNRFRSESTANAIVTTVCEFLRFGSRHGWVPAEVVERLSIPKYLRFLPPGMDAGEDGQRRTVMVKTVRYRIAEPGYEWLTGEQIEVLLGLTRNARDRFLVALMACTGIRIGEALGLRREDLHLLSGSRALGCQVLGPHLHVVRRRRNANSALAKTLKPRSIPVTLDIVGLYADAQFERDRIARAGESDMVFVNLFRGVIGRAMTYAAVKDMFDRLTARAGFPARPHMLRHSAATRWVRSGVDRDVIQTLLGHASAASMTVYLHASDADKRAAVERVAELSRAAR